MASHTVQLLFDTTQPGQAVTALMNKLSDSVGEFGRAAAKDLASALGTAAGGFQQGYTALPGGAQPGARAFTGLERAGESLLTNGPGAILGAVGTALGGPAAGRLGSELGDVLGNILGGEMKQVRELAEKPMGAAAGRVSGVAGQLAALGVEISDTDIDQALSITNDQERRRTAMERRVNSREYTAGAIKDSYSWALSVYRG